MRPSLIAALAVACMVPLTAASIAAARHLEPARQPADDVGVQACSMASADLATIDVWVTNSTGYGRTYVIGFTFDHDGQRVGYGETEIDAPPGVPTYRRATAHVDGPISSCAIASVRRL